VIDERARHDLYRAIEDLLDTKQADTLMALLPPVGWADVATKDDLHQLEARLDAGMHTRFARERGWTEVRFEAIDTRFARVETRFAQLEGRIDRSIREQTRTLMFGLFGALFTMTSLCLGAVAFAA
jgi:hypothetical protein